MIVFLLYFVWSVVEVFLDYDAVYVYYLWCWDLCSCLWCSLWVFFMGLSVACVPLRVGCVSACRWCVLLSVVHPVTILSVLCYL